MAESTGNWTLTGCRKGKRWEARKRERTVASLADPQDACAISREVQDKSKGKYAMGLPARR